MASFLSICLVFRLEARRSLRLGLPTGARGDRFDRMGRAWEIGRAAGAFGGVGRRARRWSQIFLRLFLLPRG